VMSELAPEPAAARVERADAVVVAVNTAVPSVVVLPATGLYVGAVAAVVPAVEQR
jgi:uncharacterized membrane protein